MVYYYNSIRAGLISTASTGDGYTIHLEWNKANRNNRTFGLAYHIYMATMEENVFLEGPKYISVDGSTSVDIFELTPGQLYHFAVRAVEYDPSIITIGSLPDIFSGLLVYPESLLASNITATSTSIPLIDTAGFPPSGIVKIGVELINYSSVNSSLNTLNLTNASLQRGYYGTTATIHNVDGYDGYVVWNPNVQFLIGKEEMNTKIFPCQSRFDFDQYPFTLTDGYHQILKDLLTSDLAGSDEMNQDFPAYDYEGLHGTNPNDLFSGLCVGSYIGGEMYCVDGYTGVGRMVRGLNLQDQNNQRQEVLLNLDSQKMVLLRRERAGITCDCFLPQHEYADDRCPKCHGTKFVVGYEQYFNPRRPDGRIMVRVSPYEDSVKIDIAGYESEVTLECWTLTVPTIKDRDILVRYDLDGNEEFRYEVLSVTRNLTILGMSGAQKFRMQRIRKYDPAYKIPVTKDTSELPSKIMTTSTAIQGIPAHTHGIVISEKITSLSQINQLTSVSAGHNHDVRNGVVQEALGHTHNIILP